MITRRARLGGLFLDRDLTGQVLAAIPLARFPGGGGDARLTAPDTAHVAPTGGLSDAVARAGTEQGPDGTRLPRPGRDGDNKEKEAVA